MFGDFPAIPLKTKMKYANKAIYVFDTLFVYEERYASTTYVFLIDTTSSIGLPFTHSVAENGNVKHHFSNSSSLLTRNVTTSNWNQMNWGRLP